MYREAVTVAMTSATVETSVIGDTDGAQTGDAGEVIWTNYLNGWHETPSASDVLNLSARDFLTFKNIYFFAGGSANAVDGTTTHSSDITFENCVLFATGATTIAPTAAFGTALNWTIRRCLCVNGTTNVIGVIQTTGVGADWDLNVQIVDSTLLLLGAGGCVNINSSGTSANEGGGVDMLRCTMMSSTTIQTVGTRNSLTFPSTVQDCLLISTTGMSAGEAGAITDNGGNVLTGSATNVTLHATTKTTTDDFPAALLSFAHEWMWGMAPRRFGAPLLPDVLDRGTIGSNATDMENRARPEGIGRRVDSGTATAGAATTLTDSGKTWKTDEHKGRLVRITGGTGSGQVKHISANTGTVLTIGGLSGDWATNPSTDSTYVIYEGPPCETDKATSGSTTTFVVSGAAWSVNKWAGYDLKITAGAQNGTTRTISSNTATTLTTAAFPGAIDSTSVGEIFWPGTSLTATQRTPGALELHDDARFETGTTDAGSTAICINGPGSHRFDIPVDASSTTISVKMRYDANHGTTNKPRAVLLANGEIGVSTETKTMTSAADTWETLTFSAFTPSAKGVVTVQLESRSDTPYGRAFADTFG